MTRNLKNTSYSDRFSITTAIDTLFEQAKEKENKITDKNIKVTKDTEIKYDLYRLSMPHLAIALQGDEKRYLEILPKMKRTINNFEKAIDSIQEAINQIERSGDESKESTDKSGPKDTTQDLGIQILRQTLSEKLAFKAWMLGRLLLAAETMQDEATIAAFIQPLKTLLEDSRIAKNGFYAWSLGYMAAVNKETYAEYKKSMMTSAYELTKQYQSMKTSMQDTKSVISDTKLSDKDAEKLQAAKSDTLWAWVMNIQAAAKAKDTKSYEEILDQMKLMTEQPTISLALEKGLLRVSASNDYPAWAIAIVPAASVNILEGDNYDTRLYDELGPALEQSLSGSKQSDAIGEETLARLTSTLADVQLVEKVHTATACTCVML